MWVVQTDVGEDKPLQIVTGAWNVHVGDLVPVAKHNSLLPGGHKIKKGKLRGIVSEGMFCGLSELGLEVRDFPYGEIKAAAILGDYHVLPGEKPSIPDDVQPGLRIYGKVYTARVLKCETVVYSTFKLTVDWFLLMNCKKRTHLQDSSGQSMSHIVMDFSGNTVTL
jgi:phenylalanyl-tRNA synthetase beta chain